MTINFKYHICGNHLQLKIHFSSYFVVKKVLCAIHYKFMLYKDEGNIFSKSSGAHIMIVSAHREVLLCYLSTSWFRSYDVFLRYRK